MRLPFTRKIRSELFRLTPQHKGSIFCTVIVLFYASLASTAVSTSRVRCQNGNWKLVRPPRRNDTGGTSFSFSYFQFRPHVYLLIMYTHVCAPGYSLSNPPWIHSTHIYIYMQFHIFSAVSPARDDGRAAGKRERAAQNFHLVLHLQMPAIYSTANTRGTTRRLARFLNCALQLVPRRCFFLAFLRHTSIFLFMHQIFPHCIFIPTYVSHYLNSERAPWSGMCA